MTARTKPPFRADHVGSLLRPARLKAARAKAARGEITPVQRKAVEDEEIAKVIALQEGAQPGWTTGTLACRRAIRGQPAEWHWPSLGCHAKSPRRPGLRDCAHSRAPSIRATMLRLS